MGLGKPKLCTSDKSSSAAAAAASDEIVMKGMMGRLY